MISPVTVWLMTGSVTAYAGITICGASIAMKEVTRTAFFAVVLTTVPPPLCDLASSETTLRHLLVLFQMVL